MISGGIEWDIPHHHRATSFLPMQYKIESNPDGSKTVWVGELELRDRMEWTVGLTLHSGKSYLQASFRIANRTPVPASCSASPTSPSTSTTPTRSSTRPARSSSPTTSSATSPPGPSPPPSSWAQTTPPASTSASTKTTPPPAPCSPGTTPTTSWPATTTARTPAS